MPPDDSTPDEGEITGTEAKDVVNVSERPLTEPSPGCIQLCMELTKYDNLAVFRMFEDLNMLNLLTLQAELTELRSNFIKVASGEKRWDEFHPRQIINYPGHAADFSKFIAEKGLQERLLSLRDKLEKYNATLLEVARIRNLPRPGQAQLKLLRERVRRKGRANLQELEATTWQQRFEDDLISLHTSPSGLTNKIADSFNWVTSCVTSQWNETDESDLEMATGKQFHPGPTKADERRKASLVSRLSMALFGAIALISPTLIMALHSSLHTSLITTSVATVLFGLALAFGATDSSGKDVLGATAAYCAVLIVFV